MPDTNGRFGWVVRVSQVWALGGIVLLTLCLMAACAMWARTALAAGFWQVDSLGWMVCVVGVLVAGIWGAMAYGMIQTVLAAAQDARAAVHRLNRLESLQESIHESSRRLVELAQMSDTAKSLIFRQHEIEAIGEVFHEFLLRQDYAAAEAFIADLQRTLGHAEQAARMRDELTKARTTTIEQKIDATLEGIGNLIDAQDWAGATRLADRLTKAVPANPKIRALPRLIETGKARHKSELLKQYDAAVKADAIDQSVALLRELDKYLSPQEAAALQESARGVLRARLHNWGVQFSILATDRQWAEAIAVGEKIVSEYPNTRMAQEVRQKMDSLHNLAEKSA